MADYAYGSFTPGQINNNEQNYLNDNYKNISNVSQLPNYYIKQPEQNKLIIGCSKEIYIGLLIFFLFAIFLTSLICLEVFDVPGEKSEIGIYFGCAFLGFLTCLSIYNILSSPLKQIVTFEDTGLKIVSILIFCFIPRTKFYKYSEIRRFDVKTENGRNSIIYFDENNNKKSLFPHNFTLEEAEYFKYLANKYIELR